MRVAGGSGVARRAFAALVAVFTLLAATSVSVVATDHTSVTLDATVDASAGYAVDLTWSVDEGSSTLTAQTLRRTRDDGVGPETVFSDSGTATSYTDDPVEGYSYTYELTATFEDSTSASDTVSVSVNDPVVVAATGVAVEPGNRGCLVITWDASTSTDVVKYDVYASDSAGTLGAIAGTAPASGPYTATACDLADETTYHFVVEVIDNDLPTPTAARTAPEPGTTAGVPPAPTGVVATANGSSVEISWNAVSDPYATADDPVVYEVLRSTTSGSGYAAIEEPATTGTTLTDGSLTAGTYYYIVRATRDGGYESGNSNEDGATVLAAPAAPTLVPDGATVTVTWSPVAGADRYDLQRATDLAGPFTTVASDHTVTTYADTVPAGGTYYYRVRGETAAGDEGAWSDVASTAVVAAPENVRVEIKKGDPKLDWSSVGGASLYEVRRSTSTTGPYTVLTTTNKTTYTDTATASGTTYYYVVVAIAGTTRGIPSDPVSVTTASSGGSSPGPKETPPGQVVISPEPTTEPTAEPTTEPTTGESPAAPAPEPTKLLPPGQGGSQPPGQGKKDPQPDPQPPPPPPPPPPPAGGTGGTGGGGTSGSGPAPAPQPRPQTPPVAPPSSGGSAPDGPPPGQVVLSPPSGDDGGPTRPPRRETPGNVDVRDLQFAPTRRDGEPSRELPLAVVEPPPPVEVPADTGGPRVGRAVLPPNSLADLALAQGNIGAALSASAEEVAENVGTVVRVFRIPLFLLAMMVLYLIVRERLGREVITAATDVPTGADDDDVEYLL